MRIIYVPCMDEDEAKTIGKLVVDKKLAFCANIIPKMYSCYFWKGELKENTEALLLLKTNEDFDKVKREIESLHNSDTPAIIEIPIGKVNEKYLNWSKSQP
jgi:periplasmic divalent cation tolerance protein